MMAESEFTESNVVGTMDETQETSLTSWWGGWYESAKQKIAETNEFMQRDLTEFTQSVQNDASRLVNATATTMKEKLNINVDLEEASTATKVVKESISNILGTIQRTVGPMGPDDDENDDSSVVIGTATGVQVLSPAEARLHALRTDPGTYCNEPDDNAEFHSWSETFTLEDRKKEISTLMLDCSQIRALYTKLVPNAVSHLEFWTRYFFKIYLHEKTEERRAKLVERAQKEEENIGWDDEDDWVQPDNKAEAAETEIINVEKAEVNNDEQPHTYAKEEDIQKEADKTFSQNEDQHTNDTNNETDKTTNNSLTCIDNDIKSVTEKTETETKDHAQKLLEPDLKSPTNQDITNETPKPTEKSKDAKPATPAQTNDKSSSEVSSDDWEKEFDLDMTEDEIKDALNAEPLEGDDDDWENCE